MGKAAEEAKGRRENRRAGGKLINLMRGRGTVLRPVGPCELTIVPEIHNGKIRIRVWGPDGVEIEHFRVSS